MNTRSMKGFTLLEILIAISVMTVLLGVVAFYGLDISGFNTFISENILAQNELQLTLNSMATEMRSMGPSSVGGYPIESASGNAIIFYSDIDQDGLFERVRYYFIGNTFMKGVVKPTGSPLVYNLADERTTEAVHYVVSNPANTFTYFAKNTLPTDPPLTGSIDPTMIRLIMASLTTDQDPIDEPGPVVYSISATIRNLRSGQ